MLTIPRVARFRICGRLIYWWWTRLYFSFQVNRGKGSYMCGWWLGRWVLLKCTFGGHTQSCIKNSIREYLIFRDESLLT